MTFLDTIPTVKVSTRDCLVDVTHGPMQIGVDGREWCPVCGYVPCACDGS